MSFLSLMLRNLRARRIRVGLSAVAVAVGVMTVVTIGIVTSSLRSTAVSILSTGKADFTVAQRNVSDILYSNLDPAKVARIKTFPGVKNAVGVLVAVVKIGPGSPLFLELGVPADELDKFGVLITAGNRFAPAASDQIMLGWRASETLQKNLGDSIAIDTNRYRVVGIFSTGQVYADSGAMLPLSTLQSSENKPGDVTLVVVQTTPGVPIDPLRKRIEKAMPELATVRTQAEFGNVDRNLVLISAADRGATIMALLIGGVIVLNTMLLSFFERTREFGVLRALGWSRKRLFSLVIGEALLISLIGAGVGVILSFTATAVLQRLSTLRGILHPSYTAGIFGRALIIAAGVALIGALYPATRAALLSPQDAIRRE
jgi:putative ABC transport system permease protein